MCALGPADAYDRHTGRYAPELASAFARFAGVAPEMRALDVGCGTGALVEELARVVGPSRVAAVDPSENCVSACRERVPGADVRVGDAEHLPFEDPRFGAVLAQLVIQVLDDAPRAAREMRRVAAPGGVVAACVWDLKDGMPLLSAYWDAAESVDPTGAREAGGEDEKPWCTPEELHRLWSEAALEDVRTGGFSATAHYDGFDDAWWSFSRGASPTGRFCRSLDFEQRDALREEFRKRLGLPEGPFTLTARAWLVRGSVA